MVSRRAFVSFAFTFTVTCALRAHAQAPAVAWSSLYDGPASQDEFVVHLAVDALGNVTTVGRSFNATVGFPPAPPTQDGFVARYDASGATSWTRRYDRIGGDDQFQDVAIDPATGDVIVAGYSNGYVGATFVTDVVVQRIAPNGTVLWTTVHDGPGAGPDFGRSVLLDGAGNIYVGGASYGGAATNNDLAVFAFDASGAFLWETLVDGSGHAADSGSFLAFDPSGNIAVAGSLASTAGAGNIGVALVSPTGALLWQRERDGAAHAADFGLAVQCDAAGAVYVAGWSTNGADQDPTLVKYDATGALAWALDYPELAAGNGQFRDLAIDASGRIDVLGHSAAPGTGLDLVTLQLDANGNVLWERRCDGAAHQDDVSRALAIDSSGSVVVCGYGNGPSGTTTDADSLLVRYDALGNELWRHTGAYPTTEDRAQDVALASGGRVVYAAYQRNTQYDAATVALAEPGFAFCFGDGSDPGHVSTCPCGNNGAPGRGCAHSFDANGANLSATGAPSLDDVVLLSRFEPVSSFTLFLQHDAAGDTVFHDGVLCASGTLVRLRGRAASAGAASFPNSNFAQDQTITLSQRGGVFPGQGVRRYYAAWYRNASTTFCPPATANVTNGWTILW